LAALSHALSTAVKEWGWLEDNPMRKVSKPKEPRGRVRFLSKEERKRLLAACKESTCQHLYTIVVLALSTGMRQMEILTLQWKDISLENGTIILHEMKNNERRCVPLTGHAYDLVKQLDADRKNLSTFLFPSKRISTSKPYNIRSAWDQAIGRAGIKDFRFHDLRHDFASQLLASGASLAQLSEVMGHKTLQMIKRYAHLCHSQAADVVTKMNTRIFSE
jgi:integrase